MVHTTGGSEKTDGGKCPRARGLGVGVGRDSRYGWLELRRLPQILLVLVRRTIKLGTKKLVTFYST